MVHLQPVLSALRRVLFTNWNLIMHPMLYTAIKAAREAGELISRYATKVDQLKIEQKTPMIL